MVKIRTPKGGLKGQIPKSDANSALEGAMKKIAESMSKSSLGPSLNTPTQSPFGSHMTKPEVMDVFNERKGKSKKQKAVETPSERFDFTDNKTKYTGQLNPKNPWAFSAPTGFDAPRPPPVAPLISREQENLKKTADSTEKALEEQKKTNDKLQKLLDSAVKADHSQAASRFQTAKEAFQQVAGGKKDAFTPMGVSRDYLKQNKGAVTTANRYADNIDRAFQVAQVVNNVLTSQFGANVGMDRRQAQNLSALTGAGQNRAFDAMTDFSGAGRLKHMGDVLMGNLATDSGAQGLGRSGREQALKFAELRQRDEISLAIRQNVMPSGLDLLKDVSKVTLGAGMMALGGPVGIAGGALLATSGVKGLAPTAGNILQQAGSNIGQFFGFSGQRAAQASMSEAQVRMEQLATEQQDSAVSSQRFRANQLDQAETFNTFARGSIQSVGRHSYALRNLQNITSRGRAALPVQAETNRLLSAPQTPEAVQKTFEIERSLARESLLEQATSNMPSWMKKTASFLSSPFKDTSQVEKEIFQAVVKQENITKALRNETVAEVQSVSKLGSQFNVPAGLDITEFGAIADSTRQSFGVGARFGSEDAVARRLVTMERSGLGSTGQMQQQLSSLARISGEGENQQRLERALKEGVSAGFDSSRLAQQFVSTTASIAQSSGLSDTNRVSELLSIAAKMGGRGERSVADFERGMSGLQSAQASNQAFSSLVMFQRGATGALDPRLGGNITGSLSMQEGIEVSKQLSEYQKTGNKRVLSNEKARAIADNIDANAENKSEAFSAAKNASLAPLRAEMAIAGIKPEEFKAKIVSTLQKAKTPREKQEALKSLINVDLASLMGRRGVTDPSSMQALGATIIQQFAEEDKGFGAQVGKLGGAKVLPNLEGDYNKRNQVQIQLAEFRNAQMSKGLGMLNRDLRTDLEAGAGQASISKFLNLPGSMFEGSRGTKLQGVEGIQQAQEAIKKFKGVETSDLRRQYEEAVRTGNKAKEKELATVLDLGETTSGDLEKQARQLEAALSGKDTEIVISQESISALGKEFRNVIRELRNTALGQTNALGRGGG